MSAGKAGLAAGCLICDFCPIFGSDGLCWGNSGWGVPVNVSSSLVIFEPTMKSALFVLALCFISSAQGEEGRYVKKMRISKELTAVVAEGDFEPRSIGSFTVRLYRADDDEAKRGLDVDDFAGGILLERDGQIEKVELLDLDGDSTNELIISVRSAGSGGYLSGFALGLKGKSVQILAQDLGMLQDADVASELRKMLQGKSKKTGLLKSFRVRVSVVLKRIEKRSLDCEIA